MDLAGGSVITFGERTTEWEEHYGVDIDVTREIELDPALLAGVLANPWPWLSVGVSYRMEERADTALVPNSFLIGGFDVDLAIHYANFFRPHQVSVGACLRAPEWLGLSADVTWSRWSSYLDPHSDTVSPPFSDTWTPRAGVEARVAKMLSLSAGAFYVPSPVPDQVGVSSFVDGDRLGGSLGVAWLLDLMPEPWRLPLTLRAHVQLQRMTERETVKDAARLPDADADRAGKQIVNAGYPGFSSGGSIVAGGITLSWVVP